MAHELKLYDSIGAWGITAQEFTDSIPADAKEITVRINSPGGSVGDGLAIYNYLKDHPARVETIVDGYAASMASVIMLAGDTVKVHAGSIVMVHNPWMSTAGNADELRKTAEDLDVHADALKAIYVERTGIDPDELQSLMDGETFLTGADALEIGFADALVENESPEQAAAFTAFAAMLKPLLKGERHMSTQKTRKEIAAERDELQAKVTELTEAAENTALDHAAAIEAAKIEAKAQIDSAIAERDEALAQVQAKDEEIASLTEKVDDQAKIIVSGTEDLEAARAELEETQGALEKAQEALKNPAVADAAKSDASDEDLPKSAADAEADEAEAKAREEQGCVTTHYNEYHRLMSNGESKKARTYWREHEAEIQKEQKAILESEENENA